MIKMGISKTNRNTKEHHPKRSEGSPCVARNKPEFQTEDSHRNLIGITTIRPPLPFWINLIVLFAFLLTNSIANADFLPENHAVNGGVTIVPISIKGKPEVYYQNKKVTILPADEANMWLLIVGIPINSDKSIQTLTVKSPNQGAIPFHISEKFYPTQSLTIKDIRKVDPLADDLKRIDRETKEQALLFANYTAANPYTTKFRAPAHAPISSLFGLKRVYNKQPRPPHLGLDIAAKADSNVEAIADGQVVSVSDYFYTGNTVIIDHGMGVFSLYGHLKTIEVKLLQKVKQGEVVGLVGKTGRATGPHLHWSMIVNQTYVDPLLFVPFREITKVSITPAPTKTM